MTPEDRQRFNAWHKGMIDLGLCVETVIEDRIWLLQGQTNQTKTNIAQIIYFAEKPFDKRFDIVSAKQHI